MKRLLNLGEDVDDIDEEGNTALHYAADGGFDAIVKLLVEKSADLNAANEEGDTAMHKATISNFVGIIELLVAGGANVNAQVFSQLIQILPLAKYSIVSLIQLHIEGIVRMLCIRLRAF